MNKRPARPKAHVIGTLKPYWWFVALLAVFTIAGNALGLFIPKLISTSIDSYTKGVFDVHTVAIEFSVLAFAIFLFTYLQGVTQTYLSEKAARDIRRDLAAKISNMSYVTLEKETRSKLLTNLTSDVDGIKSFISMAVVTVISSIVLIIGSATLLLMINWKLALAVLALLPIIGVVFIGAFRVIGPLFKKGQEIIDRVNSVISESIIGAALVRVLHSQQAESEKFERQNTAARDNSLKILKMFCIMIPSVSLISNLAILVILALGGHFVIMGTMTLGNFTAFMSYVYILIFPIIMLGVVSNVISRAQTSYTRIKEVLDVTEETDRGTDTSDIRGDIEVRGVTITYGEKRALKDVSFKVTAGTKTAIIGPTAAGKTQLIYALIGLLKPDKGDVLYDGKPLYSYSMEALHSQVAIVFQDSVMFNMSIYDNVAFSPEARDASRKTAVDKAIETAELGDFINTLPKGLETIVSERGTSLSGGQKQRIMLARALALDPQVLLLDDFTARVDAQTERKILKNVEKNYPGITIVSVTQKIRSVEHFEEIILLMEGEVLAKGTHAELVNSSPEYNQIIESQKSTQAYEGQ
jgi:ATP-binding cassette subfamily B protein